MDKSCLGYKIGNEVFCRPCGLTELDRPGVEHNSIRELHDESKDLSCARCGTSLGESEEG